jgi:hypothetical protein
MELERCKKCLDENYLSIKTKGYGYGYIGPIINCERHKTNMQTKVHQPVINLKWNNGEHYEKSYFQRK